MNRIQLKRWNRAVFTIAAVTLLGAPAPAQNIRSVRTYRVKADRTGDFESAIKEYNAILKKGGSNHAYTIWTSQSGPGTFLRVDHYSKWAELDVTRDPKLKEYASDLTRIGGRITRCSEGGERIIEELLPDLSLPRAGDIPKMVSVLRTRVRAEKVDEYLALMKSDLLPAVKKAGLKDYSLARVRFGAPSSEFLSVAAMDSWADLDGTSWIIRAMGEDGYQRFLAKLRPLRTESEWNIYRYMPDLSYQPTAGGSTSGN